MPLTDSLSDALSDASRRLTASSRPMHGARLRRRLGLDLEDEPAPAGSPRPRLRLRRSDAAVLALVLVAGAAPILAPALSPELRIALTRDNPLVERPHARAVADVVVLPDGAPTLWTGLRQASAERALPPDWSDALAHGSSRLPPEIALLTPPREVEIETGPTLAPQMSAGDEFATAAIGPAGALEAWREEMAIRLGAIDTGPTLAAATADPIDGAPASEPLDIATGTLADELGDDLSGPDGALPPITLADATIAVADIVGRAAFAPGTLLREPTRLTAAAWSVSSVATAARIERDLAESARDAAIAALEADTAIEDARIDAVFGEASLALEGDGPSSAPRPAPNPSGAAAALIARGGERARITLVLTAVGLNDAASAAALKRLPREVAIAVAPIADDSRDWAAAARAEGRVLLAETPLEPESYPKVNPGPLTLLVDAGDDENLRRLEGSLARVPGADGVASYLGGKFTRDAASVAALVAALGPKRLAVLDTDTTPGGLLTDAARASGLTAHTVAVSIDRSGHAKDLSEGLAELEAAAKRHGHAIGVGVTIPSTVEGLAQWIAEFDKRGLTLAPLEIAPAATARGEAAAKPAG